MVIQNLLKFSRAYALVFPSEKGHIRRLAGVPKEGGGTRCIALLDYFSQTCLAPVHRYLYKILNSIPQDCTDDLDSFTSKTAKWVNPYYSSVDLKNATDRFPISVICLVLGWRFPAEWVSHWKNILVGYPYFYEGKEYSYSVGNPMGAYSSYTSFALAHHFVVFVACVRRGID